ncbi:MAG: sporulation transcriptional regulator SpoIIID [Caldicoprobacter sp.]|uniref:sporulation transcriptional regulator SpoIIID n=1 Tax=Caldicoprobacter sp. TaxID=2004500 RepID=UPI0039C3CCAD
MKDYIEERVLEIANYMIQSKATVREVAKVFKVSKSTVHKDVSERLPKINPILWEEVKKVLEYNKAERHIRGGKATRLKYKKMKEQN